MEARNLIEVGSKVIELDPTVIKRGWRARQDYGDIDDLAESIATDGQMQPVLVKKSKKSDHYFIIAGMRRLKACRKLGINVKAIEVSPSSEMHSLGLQLSENVKRKSFDKLETAEGLKRLKKVYEKAHPETKHGATGKGRKKGRNGAQPFYMTAMKMLGIGRSEVGDLLQIGDLSDDLKKEIESAKTTKTRNIAAKKALKKVRLQRKKEKLVEAAKEKRVDIPDFEDAQVPETESSVKIALYRKSCFEGMREFEPASFDLIYTDPPYELSRSVIYHENRANINDTEDVKWDKLNMGWVFLAAPLLIDGGQIIAHCPLEAISEYRFAFEQCDIKYRGAIIWHKTNPGTVHRPTYLPSCEAIVWGTKGDKYLFNEVDNGGDEAVHNFREGPICAGNERLDHPAQKPMWLVEDILLRHSEEDFNVLDPFAGVGTTLVCCKMHNRNCYGFEIDQEYVKQSRLRLEAV